MSDESKAGVEGVRIHVFDDFLLRERQALNLPCAGEGLADPCGSAMAISGGGLRSSFFALGVIQTFMNEAPGNAVPDSSESCFDRFDYLSTVSGGGYIGAAVCWLKYQFSRDGAYRSLLGVRSVGSRSAEFNRHGEGLNSQFTWLDMLRQHGSFLKPASSSSMTLVADVLGNSVLSLGIYTMILASIFWSLTVAGVLPVSEQMPEWPSAPQRIENVALLLLLCIGGTIFLSGIVSWLASVPTRAAVYQAALLPALLGLAAWHLLYQPDYALIAAVGANWRMHLGLAAAFVMLLSVALIWKMRAAFELARSGFDVVSSWQYIARNAYHSVLGALLTLLIVAGVLWSVPHVYRVIETALGQWLTAVVGSTVGLAGSVAQFLWARQTPLLGGWFTTLRVLVIGVLLVYGVLLLAYLGVLVLGDFAVDAEVFEIPLLALVGIAGVGFAVLINLNYVSIVRTYRDRLMEVFMPDPASIRANQSGPARKADAFKLHQLVDADGNPQRPLHLVNCNVMMSGSRQLRFRGRGGDNFLLSSMFCGSSVTGWTRADAAGGFEYATAIACSAAGSNMPAAVAGLANSRNPFALLLLSVTNLRPSYWIRNPRVGVTPRWWHLWFPPNLIAPGIGQGLLGRKLSEESFFLEINDGGRFDNTGVYELIRRRLKIIVLTQSSVDPDFTMEDLARVIRLVRIDFGVHIRFSSESYPLAALRPSQAGASAQRGWAVGTIKYPGTDTQGVLLYIQATPLAGMNADVDSYKRRFAEFPNLQNSDDRFDEEQVEAYRELGMAIAQDAVAALKGKHEPGDEPMTALRRTFGW